MQSSWHGLRGINVCIGATVTTRRSGWFFCLLRRLRRIHIAGAERERRLHPEQQQQDTFADQMNVASSEKHRLRKL